MKRYAVSDHTYWWLEQQTKVQFRYSKRRCTGRCLVKEILLAGASPMSGGGRCVAVAWMRVVPRVSLVVCRVPRTVCRRSFGSFDVSIDASRVDGRSGGEKKMNARTRFRIECEGMGIDSSDALVTDSGAPSSAAISRRCFVGAKLGGQIKFGDPVGLLHLFHL